MAQNRIIGSEGKIPWHLPQDLQFFKATTLGHPIVMGRKTYESIGKPLPERQNIVLSRTMNETQGVTLVRSTEELLSLPSSSAFFVIGGAEIYRLLLPYCEELLVTHVRGAVVGDTSFPDFETEFDQGALIFETNDFKTLRYRRSP